MNDLVRFIEENKDLGVEPICATLTSAGCSIAPSTFYAARNRPPSRRAVSDAVVDSRISALRASNALNATLGSRKTWRLLNAQEPAHPVARCTVERRMRALGLSGVGPGRSIRTTRPARCTQQPTDLLRRDFTADAPNRRWVVDFTYVRTWSGFCYTAFVMDLYSRTVVGWSVSTVMDTSFVLSALEQAVWTRSSREGRSLKGLVHHSDHGSQYLSIRYSERLASEGIEASTGKVGSSYDNAAAEALNKSYKQEVIWRRSWPGRDEVEKATAQWVSWYNSTRPHRANPNDMPPAIVEALYDRQSGRQPAAA